MNAASSGALTGSVALVTGGSSGIGEAIGRLFAHEGCSVAIVASRNLGKAERVARDIAAQGGRALAFACDVRDRSAIKDLIGAVETSLGPIDILVNSAGVFYPTPMGATPSDAFDEMVDVNFKGTWLCIDAVAAGMIARGRGKIINLASVAGTTGLKTYSAYCATKAAIIMMTKAMARELAPHGVNVNAIAPGNTATPMNDSVRAPENAEIYDAMEKITPSGNVFSSTDEIAATALFLVSAAARPMHGTTLLIDEGLSTGF